MTCIAGVAQGGRVWIGGDSSGVSVDNLGMMLRADPKVFRRGEFLMGFCGSFRVRDLLQYSANVPEQNRSQTDREFLATTFVDWVRDALDEGGVRHKNDGVESMDDSAFLVGYRGKLYQIDSDFQVGESLDNFDAVGCGASVALGALYAAKKLSPTARIRRALEAAERYSVSVRSPFRILSR